MSWNFSTDPMVGRDAAVDGILNEINFIFSEDDDRHHEENEALIDTITRAQRAECEMVLRQLKVAIRQHRLIDFFDWLFARSENDQVRVRLDPSDMVLIEEVLSAMRVEIFK